MDVRERYPQGDALVEIVETMIDRRMSGMHIAMPVKVTKDSDGHTVTLQPLIKRVQRMPDGTEKQISYPEIQDAPVQFSSGGGKTMTHPIKEGDEGLIIVGSRGFDAWHQQGGEQGPIDARHHDLSDSFYIPGVRSTPRKLDPPPSSTSAQVRTDDGKSVADISDTGVLVKRNNSAVNTTDNSIKQDSAKILMNC